MDSAGRRQSILIVAERYPPDEGGVSRSASRVARSLHRFNIDVHVLVWTKRLPSGALSTTPDHDAGGRETGVTVHRVGRFSSLDFTLQHSLNILESLHRQHAFDACWGHYLYPAGYFAVLFAETVSITSTVSARGNDVDRLMFPPGDFARLTWTLERAGSITAVSHDLARKIRILIGRDAPCTVLPNFVDTDVFRPCDVEESLSLRQSLGISSTETVLGFCGELRHKKGLPFVLAAFASLLRDRDAKLLVIGSVRRQARAQIDQFVSDHPAAIKNMVVTGELQSVDDVARHLQLCDVVLQPSVWDGMPNALLEAMACGQLVLASDAGGIPEVVEHGKNGFILPRGQLHLLSHAIKELLAMSPEAVANVRGEARAHVCKWFSLEREVRYLEPIVDALFPSAVVVKNGSHASCERRKNGGWGSVGGPEQTSTPE